jgi:hypothetical protein
MLPDWRSIGDYIFLGAKYSEGDWETKRIRSEVP